MRPQRPISVVREGSSQGQLVHVERVRDGVPRGAYVLADANGGPPDLLLLATGSEVSTALGACELLAGRGIRARVVSMPSWEIFEEQPQAYRDEVLPPALAGRLAIEAAASLGWRKYVGDRGDIVALDRFGASASASVLLEQFGFTPEHIAERAAALVERLVERRATS